MSLFEDSRYIYRDTFFVFFREQNRPDSSQMNALIKKLGTKYNSQNLREEDGRFDSVSVFSPQDYSAMDIVCVDGDDVKEQIHEITAEFKAMTLTGEDRDKLKQLTTAECRFDVFHFAEVSETDDDEDDFLDPGGLMSVLDRLAELTNGVSYDPQSQSLL